MEKRLDMEDAVSRILEIPVLLKTENVDLMDALGRVAAQDIIADASNPPFDKSPYDGYALRGIDTLGASENHPVTLKVIEEIPAGKYPQKTVTEGCCSKILTGGPVPQGADAIIKYETVTMGEGTITVTSETRPNTDIVYAGEEYKAGDVLISKGSVLTAPMLGVAASLGYGQLSVYRRPLVGMINTGSELVMPGDGVPAPGMIYNSSAFAVAGYLKDMGCQVKSYGIVPDDNDRIAALLANACLECDMVITTGGASVGDYDYAVSSSESCGADIMFWKVKMKPGGSIVCSRRGDKFILGLSGNPGAALLGLHVIASPFVRKLCGRSDVANEFVKVTLLNPVKKKSPMPRMLRGEILLQDGRAMFRDSDAQGNGSILSFVGSNAIAIVPAGSPPQPAGTELMAIKIR